MLDRLRAFFEGDGELRAVGDGAGDQRAADAGFELALQETLERPRADEFGDALLFPRCLVC